MRRIAFDVETHLIKPGMLFPRLVCVSVSDGTSHDLFLAALGVKEILKYLADPNVILVGHNVTFDLGVVCAEAIDQGYDPHYVLTLVFQAYQDNRIVDTMIRSMLVDIAKGDFKEIDGQRRGKVYGLDMLAQRWLTTQITQKTFTKKQANAGLASSVSWRLHFAFLQNTPLDQWPPDAYDYALEDVVITWNIDQQITAWAISEGQAQGEIPDEFRQARGAWVLHLMAGWGVHVDSELVKLVKENLVAQRTASYAIMEQWAIFKKDRDGNYKRTKKGQICKDQKRLKELIAEGYAQRGETPPMTDGRVNKATGIRVPEIGVSADTARESGHPACVAFADVASADKLLSTYIPILERGAGGMPVTSSPNILVSSGRTSWTNPNWQNPPKLGGIRECVIPRPGKVFVSADLDTVELRALAQSCLEILGYSEMASALQRGEDLHLSLAAEFIGVDYPTALAMYNAGDPIITENRHTAKQVNFGLPGGMGAKKFALTAIANGTPLITDPNAPFSEHVTRAHMLREIWFKRWPEMRAYLKHAGDITGDFGPCMISQPWSGRIRGGLEYCACANTFFQGRVADGAKLALWRIAWACYVDKTSVLYGSRLVLFLHDEVILECPEGLEHECGLEIAKLLCGAVQEVIPNIPITSTAVAMRRWRKGAKPVIVGGKLVPSRPIKDSAGKITWIHDDGTYLGDHQCLT